MNEDINEDAESKDGQLLTSTRYDTSSKYVKQSNFKIVGRKPIATIQDKDFLLDPEFEGV